MHLASCSKRDNGHRASECGRADAAWDVLLPGVGRGFFSLGEDDQLDRRPRGCHLAR